MNSDRERAAAAVGSIANYERCLFVIQNEFHGLYCVVVEAQLSHPIGQPFVAYICI